MILYSIVPAEIVFAETGADSTSSPVEMDYLGERVQVTSLSNNRYVINRIISTSLKAFLDPRLQPGSVITATEAQLRNQPAGKIH